MRTKSILKCPGCAADFSTDRVRELRQFFFRRQADCRTCGRMLSYAKWPWWLMNAGTIATFFAFAFPIAIAILGSGEVDSPLRQWLNIYPVLLLIAALFFWPAVRYNRLVCVDPFENNQKDE